MRKKLLNNIIVGFILGMGIYHLIPSEYLIGRLIYYISLYGIITAFLFYFIKNEKDKKHKRYYLIASFYSIGKMGYHLYVAITKYKFNMLGLDSELAIGLFSILVFVILLLIKLNNKYG